MVVSGDGWTSALPVPVAASTTVLPRITLPYWSRPVTVIVLALLPVDAVIVAGDATTVVWDALTTVAVIVKVTGVRPAAPAVVVWVPGVAPRVRIVLACPFTSVCEVVGFTEPPPEAAAQLTVTLGTGLPFASVTSTVCGVL